MLIVGGLSKCPSADRRPNQTDYQMYDELKFSSNYSCLSCVNQLGEFCILDICGQWSLGITLGLCLLCLPRNIQGVIYLTKLMQRREEKNKNFSS